ncbi:MAG: hypothetical protein GF317_23360 [Candidatus Lokiarchaeota archaeon]|nr:hypothetical protein [Candidatus Lokiarchaeota archaeon]
MVREIKFKVWDYNHNKFVTNKDSVIDIMLDYDTGLLRTIARYKLLQYIGLKDKNGNEIYEGDVIKDNVGRIWLIDFYEENSSFIFRYIKDLSQYQYIDRFLSFQLPLEIIGNKFCNPELLEK